MKTALQACRKRAGYKSANAFADRAGVNRHTYTDQEQGKSALSLEAAWAYADILGCTLDEIAGREFPKRYSDSRQEAINRDFDVLDDAMKDAAAASIRGMATASIRGEDAATGAEHSSRTA